MGMYAVAKTFGVVLIVLGIAGLIMGEQPVFGLINIDLAEDVVHLITGGILAYVGFRGTPEGVKSTLMTLGVIYLLVGVVGFISPGMFGILSHGYSLADNVIHLLAGGIMIGGAFMRPAAGRI
jgi:hypothetical protein